MPSPRLTAAVPWSKSRDLEKYLYYTVIGVIFNDIQVVLELSVDLERRLTWPGTHDFGQHEAIIEATCRFK